MKIIIVGCGKVGTTLAEQLNRENHDITLIDTDDEALCRPDERNWKWRYLPGTDGSRYSGGRSDDRNYKLR